MSIQITVPTPTIIGGKQRLPCITVYELQLEKFGDCEGKRIYESTVGLFLTKTAAMNYIKHLQSSFKSEPEWWMRYPTDTNGNLICEIHERYLILK